MPMVTLHHFTNPVWLTELGGWLNPEIVGRFERYTRRVVGALHDLVGLWVTINEPNVYAYGAYLAAGFPPGEKDMGKTIRVMKNMVMAHAAAYHAIHEIQPESQVGLAHHFRGMKPARPGNPLDRLVSHERSRIFNANIPRAVHDGWFRFLGRAERLPQAAKTQDFFGVNYYTVERVAFDLSLPGELFGRAFYPDGSDLSQTGLIANVPEGLGETLAWARRFGLPIYVTENGVEDAHDTLRPRYLAAHILQVWHAVQYRQSSQGILPLEPDGQLRVAARLDAALRTLGVEREHAGTHPASERRLLRRDLQGECHHCRHGRRLRAGGPRAAVPVEGSAGDGDRPSMTDRCREG